MTTLAPRILGCVALLMSSACGVPEANYYTVVHDALCEQEASCNPLLTKEECLTIAPEHVGKTCVYDASLALECKLALEDATCTSDEITGQQWFETPDVCLQVWDCE